MSIEKAFDVIIDNFSKLKIQSDKIEEIAKVWIDALSKGNKIIFCGNGGSAADSQHLAAELMVRYKLIRNQLPAMSLTTDTSALTAIGNDLDFKQIFSRQLLGVGNEGDVLVAISTSGNSENVIDAIKVAKTKGIKTIAFTGENGGEAIKFADISLKVPSNTTNNVQEMHIASGHMICNIVEEYFFGNGDKNTK